MDKEFLISSIIGLLIGVVITAIVCFIISRINNKKSDKIIDKAKKEAEKYKRDAVLELKEEQHRLKQEFEKELKDKNEYKNLREFSDDWFPYIDQYSLTWTGYFTSRPYMKGKSRESSILYDVISMLNTEYFFQFHKSNHDFFTSQEPAQKAIALVQHHDGIAGTGKSFVHEDYINQLIEGDEIIMKKSGEILDDIFNYKNIKVCLSNGKVNLGCKFDLVKYENGEFKFGIYNPGLNGKILFTIELDFSVEKVKFHLFDHYKRKIGYN